MNRSETSAAPLPSIEPSTGEQIRIPIIEEQLQVGKQIVETDRVRISKHVREEAQMVDVPLIHEELEVERVPVNQIVSSPPPPIRYEGDTMIIPILQETLVVEKRLLLVEELRVTKRQVETHAPQEFTLLKEELEVERASDYKQTAADLPRGAKSNKNRKGKK